MAPDWYPLLLHLGLCQDVFAFCTFVLHFRPYMANFHPRCRSSKFWQRWFTCCWLGLLWKQVILQPNWFFTEMKRIGRNIVTFKAIKSFWRRALARCLVVNPKLRRPRVLLLVYWSIWARYKHKTKFLFLTEVDEEGPGSIGAHPRPASEFSLAAGTLFLRTHSFWWEPVSINRLTWATSIEIDRIHIEPRREQATKQSKYFMKMQKYFLFKL